MAITIFDASGAQVRALRGTNQEGVNRVSWDLRWDPTEQVHLRSTPSDFRTLYDATIPAFTRRCAPRGC